MLGNTEGADFTSLRQLRAAVEPPWKGELLRLIKQARDEHVNYGGERRYLHEIAVKMAALSICTLEPGEQSTIIRFGRSEEHRYDLMVCGSI